MTEPRTCNACPAVFLPRRDSQRSCSPRCSKRARARPSTETKPCECGCGGEVVRPYGIGAKDWDGRRFIDRDCYARWQAGKPPPGARPAPPKSKPDPELPVVAVPDRPTWRPPPPVVPERQERRRTRVNLSTIRGGR